MKRYETRAVPRRCLAEETCDGCGVPSEPHAMGRLTSVAIEVDPGEEGGRRDEYDYCDDCLVARAEALTAAGSRAPLVTGDWTPVEGEDE